MMKRILILAAFAVPVGLAAPALFAQDDAPWQPPLADQQPDAAPDPGDEDGVDMIGRGVGILMENFMRQMRPELDQLGQDMSGALDRMAPVLKDLAVLVDDLGNYQAPERLENGDIVIRRKADAPPPPPIGEDLRNFTQPDAPSQDQPAPDVPRDPDAPEFEL